MLNFKEKFLIFFLVIFGHGAFNKFLLFESSWKNMKKDITTFTLLGVIINSATLPFQRQP